MRIEAGDVRTAAPMYNVQKILVIKKGQMKIIEMKYFKNCVITGQTVYSLTKYLRRNQNNFMTNI